MFNLPIIPPTVPEGFCSQLTGNDWIQQLANLIVGKAVAQLDGTGFTVVLNQETQPGPDQISSLWRQPSTAGRGIYSYVGGAWVIPHPSPPSGDERRLWVGALGAAGLDVFDGGAVGAVGANSGPMWEEDPDFRGRSPMGPGTIPTANPAKILAVEENYGEGAHLQTAQELALHAHKLVTKASITNANGTIDVVESGAGLEGLQIGATGPATTALEVLANTFTTVQQSMPILHPIRGAYVIRRTGRVNYVGS